MDTVIRLIFAPIQPFIGHPEHVFAAVGFAMLLAIAVIRTSAFQWRQLHRGDGHRLGACFGRRARPLRRAGTFASI
ncbi:MAG: hypothetical protein U0992_11585 [Planctomycetaceae bacterium]